MRKREAAIVAVSFMLVLLMLAIFLIREKQITGYQVLGPQPSNTLTITSKELTTITNYPVMIGRPFVQGEIIAGNMPQVSINGIAVTRTQVDVKNRWPDGSIKFAIISFILPQLNAGETKNIVISPISNSAYLANVGSTPISTNAMLNNFNFDAVTEISNSGGTHTISARTMIQNNHFTNWLSGPVVTAVNLADHSLAAQYDVGWKQTKTQLIKNLCPSTPSNPNPVYNCAYSATDSVFYMNNANLFNVNDILNVQDEYVRVLSRDTSSTPNSITVQRGYAGGLPASYFSPDTVGVYLTSNTWQPLSLPADDPYRSFRPLYHVYFWPDINKYQVMFVGEISNTEKLQDLTYDVALRTGLSSPVTVLTQNGVTQHAGSRWGRDFWSGAALPKVEIDHNLNYLSETKFVPKFDPSLNVPDFGTNSFCTSGAFTYNGWLAKDKSLMKLGSWTLGGMGAGGSRPDLRWVPCWDTLWLNTMDYRAKDVVESQSELSASWPMHFREGDPTKIFDRDPVTGALGSTPAIGRVVSPTARPSTALNSPGFGNPADLLNFVSRATHGEISVPGGWTTDAGHTYNPNYIDYLTGRYWAYEEMLFWASYGTLETAYSRGPDANSLGGYYGALTNPYGPRYMRPMTQRIYAAQLAVDGTPEDILFDRLTLDAIETWMGIQNIPLSAEPTIVQNPRDLELWQFGRDLYSTSTIYSTVTIQNLPNPLHFWSNGVQGNCVGSPIDPAYAGASCESPWWIHIVSADIFIPAKDFGLPVGSLIDYMTDYYSWHFNTPGVSPYSIGSYREVTADASNLVFTSPLQVYNAFDSAYKAAPCFQQGGIACDTFPYEGDGYFFWVLAASANMYDYDPAIYNWMRAEAQASFNAGSPNHDPAYAFVPRSLGLSCSPNMPSNCVTGLFGVCSAGTTQCNAQGTGYGVCNAGIQPGQQTEICDGNDNDCDGVVDEGCPTSPNPPTSLNAQPSGTGAGSPTGSATANAAGGVTYGGIGVPQTPAVSNPSGNEDTLSGGEDTPSGNEPAGEDDTSDAGISGRATDNLGFGNVDWINIILFTVIIGMVIAVYFFARRTNEVSEEQV